MIFLIYIISPLLGEHPSFGVGSPRREDRLQPFDYGLQGNLHIFLHHHEWLILDNVVVSESPPGIRDLLLVFAIIDSYPLEMFFQEVGGHF